MTTNDKIIRKVLRLVLEEELKEYKKEKNLPAEIFEEFKWGNPLLVALIWLFAWPRIWVVRSVGSPETLFVFHLDLSPNNRPIDFYLHNSNHLHSALHKKKDWSETYF